MHFFGCVLSFLYLLIGSFVLGVGLLCSVVRGISSVIPVIELSYFLFFLLLCRCRCLSVNNLWMCCGWACGVILPIGFVRWVVGYSLFLYLVVRYMFHISLVFRCISVCHFWFTVYNNIHWITVSMAIWNKERVKISYLYFYILQERVQNLLIHCYIKFLAIKLIMSQS